MFGLAVAVFLVLHALVHPWYVVLSQGWVEVEDAMDWNGQSWLLSDLLAQGTILSLASVLYALTTVHPRLDWSIEYDFLGASRRREMHRNTQIATEPARGRFEELLLAAVSPSSSLPASGFSESNASPAE